MNDFIRLHLFEYEMKLMRVGGVHLIVAYAGSGLGFKLMAATRDVKIDNKNRVYLMALDQHLPNSLTT